MHFSSLFLHLHPINFYEQTAASYQWVEERWWWSSSQLQWWWGSAGSAAEEQMETQRWWVMPPLAPERHSSPPQQQSPAHANTRDYSTFTGSSGLRNGSGLDYRFHRFQSEVWAIPFKQQNLKVPHQTDTGLLPRTLRCDSKVGRPPCQVHSTNISGSSWF